MGSLDFNKIKTKRMFKALKQLYIKHRCFLMLLTVGDLIVGSLYGQSCPVQLFGNVQTHVGCRDNSTTIGVNNTNPLLNYTFFFDNGVVQERRAAQSLVVSKLLLSVWLPTLAIQAGRA